MSELPRNGYQDEHLVHIVSNHQLKGKKKKAAKQKAEPLLEKVKEAEKNILLESEHQM